MLSRPLATALRATTKQQQQQWLPVTAAAHTRAPMTARRPLLQRSFASEPTIKRPKPIKVKKSEARRRVEPKAEDSVAASEQHPQNALTEARQAPPPSPYMPSEQQQQPTFGQMMKAVRVDVFHSSCFRAAHLKCWSVVGL